MFDSNGVAVQNPHLRRVTADEVIAEMDEVEYDLEHKKGVYVTVPCSDQAFTISVDGPGTFTIDTQSASGVIGMEWVGDE